MIERLRVRVPAGAARELSCPELTFCAKSYLVSVPPTVTAVARKGLWSFCQTCRWQFTSKQVYILDPAKSKWANYAVRAQCGNLSGKRAHMQLAREHAATVVLPRRATVD